MRLNSSEFNGIPVTIQLPSGTSSFSGGFVFDSTFRSSEVRIEGVPGTVIGRSSAGRRRRLTVSKSDPPMFTLSPGTTTRVILIGLRIEGKLEVKGGSLEVNNCTLDGLHSDADAAASDEGAIGLYVSGGNAVLNRTTVVSFEGGGMKVAGLQNAKLLEVTSSIIRLNGRSSAARIGGISAIGGTADVTNTLIEDNGYDSPDCDAGRCVQGGGLRVDVSGNAILRAGTLLRQNKAYEGRSIYVSRDSLEPNTVQGPNNIPFPVVYHLPAPPAHFIVIVERAVTNSKLRKGLIDENYPFECAPGNYGANTDRDVQSTPRCSGPCTAGYYCPLATIQPIMCSMGTYCPRGSAIETSCPAGTFGPQQGLSNVDQCQTCKAGTQCPIGSEAPTKCAPGSYAPINGTATCSLCGSGYYQDAFEQTSCKICTPGHACPMGSASPTPCPAGFYASAAGLNDTSQCTVRKLASYCVSQRSALWPNF